MRFQGVDHAFEGGVCDFRDEVQFKSFKSFKSFKLFKLFKSCLRRIHLLLVSEVLPVDNVSIGSRCIGVDIPVFFLTSLDRVAWTINLRGSLLSQRHSISVLVDHV